MNRKIILSIVFLVVMVFSGCSLSQKSTDIGQEEAKNKALKFVTENLVQPGTKLEVKEVIKENDLYKITLDVSGQEIIAYMTQDGKKFFPSVMDMEEVEQEVAESKKSSEEEQKEVPKQDVPEVKLFVMSYCPYGTQIEKGILPVLAALKDKINFSLEFVDYAMHDKKEIDENLRQYCVQKNEPAKLASYLQCFLKNGNAQECLNSNGINSASLNSCVNATDSQFKITEKYNDKSQWETSQFPPFDVNKDDNGKYAVEGSPSLVINETKIASARDAASLLKTICSGFNIPPEECQAELSSTVPSSGFGEGSGSGSNASCGE
ncbi:MAG TPA: hypothetical protein PLK35_01325 [Candidatus Moranbacteria bacterium]|nr:hypothetical protein [Candidatus Moranbacteria bacterium]